MSNIFKQFRDYQSRNVDYPSYEPLGQSITLWSNKKWWKDRKEYQREYYKKNKERLKEYQRMYWKKKHAKKNPRWDLIWIQKDVYEYLLDQYRRGEDPARWTEIAKALGVSENSVYTAVFQLTKKGYLGRWTYWRYLLLKFPDKEESKEEKEITYEDIESVHKTLVWRWYLDELADRISAGLVTQNKELYEENLKLKEQLQKIKDAWMKHEKSVDAYYHKWQDNYSDLDQIIMNR